MLLFQKTMIRSPDPGSIRTVCRDYEIMLVTILDEIIRRFQARPDYPFIDTKLDTLTGRDFPEPGAPDEDFRSRSVVYGWIQGRGLEALAGHARWLPSCTVLHPDEQQFRIQQLDKIIAELLDTLEAVRARNGGHLYFSMTAEGHPFTIDRTGEKQPVELLNTPPNMSDLFYVKGMMAAATRLGLPEKQQEARDFFQQILNAIEDGSFIPDQTSFDPKNRVEPVPGKQTQSPRMIALGALALFQELDPKTVWVKRGENFIRTILSKHVNTGSHETLEKYDFWEAVHEDGSPWIENGILLSDPGHALEFIGLAGRLLLFQTPENSVDPLLMDQCRTLFPGILLRNFKNGFNPDIGGICKSFDLLNRNPVNSDMPWWNLPETLRAAALCLHLFPGLSQEEKTMLYTLIMKCSNGFIRNFVNPDVHLMARQTLSRNGIPVETIPATPDADPGYHTGLSIIDFLSCTA